MHPDLIALSRLRPEASKSREDRPTESLSDLMQRFHTAH